VLRELDGIHFNTEYWRQYRGLKLSETPVLRADASRHSISAERTLH
jgi:hypothetical protein